VLVLALLFSVCGDRTFQSGRCFYSASTYIVGHLFFHLGGGKLLHSALSLIFWSQVEDLTVNVMTSSRKVCLRVLLGVFLPCCCLMPLPNALHAPLRTWSSCSAGKARWVNCSMVVAVFCRDLPSSWVVFSVDHGFCGQIPVPKSVLSCPDSLLIQCSFRSSV
jgi:hypothetical protein